MMKNRQMLSIAVALILLLVLTVGYSGAQGPGGQGGPLAPLGTSFTYQGRLRDGAGNPITSSCDFAFSLWDAESSGTQVGGDSTVTGVSVADGYFAALVDAGGEFGATAFSGEARWLQIAVQCTGDPGYTTLSPRQPLAPAPYARYSLGSPWSGLTGVPDLQLRVSGTCASGNAIRVVNGDGSVTCEPVSGGGPHDHWGETWSGSGTGLILSGGWIGLSGTGTGFGLYGQSSSTTGVGAAGWASADGGETYGVYGETDSTSGRGVYGYADATSGTNYGVYGRSDSPDGYGVAGWGSAVSGTAYGVYGRSDSPDGRAVYGRALATYGTNYGVYGRSDSTDGRGVLGYATASTGPAYGVRGVSESTEGYGVYGWASTGSGDTYGVYGRSSSTDGTGVRGYASANSGYTYGVYGVSDSPDGTGVSGWATATSAGLGASEGVYGRSDGDSGRGVYGIASATSSTNYGVYGVTQSPDGYGVYYVGGLGGTGLTTSIVETRDYGWRHLYTMESPGNWFEDFGTAQLVHGRAEVAIEPIFAQTVNLEEPYQVFLTPLGQEPVLLFISSQTGAGFTVQGVTLSGQPAAGSFHYRIVARRLGYEDARLAVAQPPPSVEVEPPGGER